jgi:NTP pyrophosphatase (non-canonical NTP hydrolase)
MELGVMQKQVDQWIQSIGVRYFNELTNTAILMEEVGEVARIMARKFGEQSKKPEESNQDQDDLQNLADELADVLFVLICLSNQTGINLEEAFTKNLQKKYQRDRNRHRENPKLKS